MKQQRTEINELENRKTIDKVTETKNGLPKKNYKIGKPLIQLIALKREREKNYLFSIGNETEDITDLTDIKGQ